MILFTGLQILPCITMAYFIKHFQTFGLPFWFSLAQHNAGPSIFFCVKLIAARAAKYLLCMDSSYGCIPSVVLWYIIAIDSNRQ